MSRRNLFIRSVATLCGDFAFGFAMASACVWIIQAAALGVFLTFLLWLMALISSLAISQHVIRPVIAVLLSDRKLDEGLRLSAASVRSMALAATSLWSHLREQGLDPRSFMKTT